MRKLCQLKNSIDTDAAGCVPNRLRRHGAYDLAGRVAALFCPDSLLLSHQRESKR